MPTERGTRHLVALQTVFRPPATAGRLSTIDRSLGAQPLHVQFGADGASCATAITTTRAWPDSRLSLVTRERCVRGEGGSLDAGRLRVPNIGGDSAAPFPCLFRVVPAVVRVVSPIIPPSPR